MVVTESGVQLVGSCFCIDPSGLYMTATHVAEECLGIAERSKDSTIFVVYRSLDAETDEDTYFPVDILNVANFAHGGAHDVAILEVDPVVGRNGGRGKFEPLSLSLMPPQQGEAIFGFGYSGYDVRGMQVAADGALEADLNLKLYASKGIVQNVYVSRRDPVMMKFPGFESTARFSAGTSGGPVVAAGTGRVCGVVTAGTEHSDGSHTSYASSVLCAAQLEVKDGNDGSTSQFFELLRTGQIDSGGDIEHIDMHLDSNGTSSFIDLRADPLV